MGEYKFETLQVHAGQEQPDPATGARAVPIYQTTSYVFDDSAHAAARFDLTDSGNIYGRLTNNTQEVLETRIAALEGGTAALAFASGAAAITYTIMALAQAGGDSAFVTYIRAILLRDIKGGQKEAWDFIDNLKIFSLLANVADVKSLVIHPATTTHSELSAEELADQGINPNTIRLSIGTEHIDDILKDLENAFTAVL